MRLKLLLLILLIIVGIISSQHLTAQEYSFTHYNASNGLLSSEILSIAKDKRGFLWLGTSAGISFYDGYSFTNYQYAEDNHFLGRVNVIKSYNSDTLWIGAGSGLYCMINGKLKKLSVDDNSPQGINDFFLTTKGDMWLATENGPVFIKASLMKNVFKAGIKIHDNVLASWPKKNAFIDDRRATLISQSPDGTVYVAQWTRIFKILESKTELVFDAKENTDQILSIFPINKNKIFFDCARSEMNKIDNGVWSNIYSKKSFKEQHLTGQESFWYAGTAGLFHFNPVTELFDKYVNTISKGVSWPSGFVKDGHVFWLATHDGLIKLKPAVFSRYDSAAYKNVKEVFSFLKLKDGSLLAGGNRGELWKKSNDYFSNFIASSNRVVANAEIKSLFEDDRGWIWAGTGYQGLALIRDKKVSVFTEEQDGLNDNTIHYIFKTNTGKIFAVGDQGLTEIIVDHHNNISFKKFYYLPNSSVHAPFYSGIEAPDGTIWIGGEEGLFYLKNDSLRHFYLLNKTIPINNLKMADDGSVWIATAGVGILQCDFEKDTLRVLKKFDETNGLNTSLFIDILVDKQQNIWAGSAKGLSFIGRNNPYTGAILNFDATDGFIKPGYSQIRLYQEDDSLIWAGTTRGLASFNPHELFLANNHPAAYILSINFPRAGSTILSADLGHSKTFSYNNNSISFNYTAVDFANQESVNYYYKLNGADTVWQNAGSTRSVTYQNLQPGNYAFSVKALNGKGEWSENEALYSFTIATPFWRTWWFIALSISTAAGLIAVFIRQRIKAAEKREIQKTEIEKLKAASYRYQLEIEQVINYFSTSINQQSNVDDMLWDVAKNCISTLGFEDCIIYLLDEENKVLVQKAAWGPKTTDKNKIVNPIEIRLGEGIVGSVALTGKAEIIDDTSLDERYIVDDALRFSEITVPIKSNSKTLGVIDSEHSEKNFYTQRHLQILTTIASQLADKIDKLIAAQQAREKEIELLKLNKDLATWQITALRSQMNPHFIFNAMNSIQQFTLQNDSDNANRYISKFSTLLRKVLYSSQLPTISLEEEIEQLQLYLDIEKLRMGESFSYDITVDEEIETDAIKMPGMLLQPFVENAVKHGLALKEGAKRLNILFAMPDEFHLHAVITDNGIGRQKSAELKAHQKLMPHISKGIQLVKERLELLQQDKNLQASIHINDLPAGAGTSVTLIIPVS